MWIEDTTFYTIGDLNENELVDILENESWYERILKKYF